MLIPLSNDWVEAGRGCVHGFASRRAHRLAGALLVAELTHLTFPSLRLEQTKRKLEEGIELGDKTLITEALAKAEVLRQEWGSIDIPQSQIERAWATLDIIRKEETALSDLRTALTSAGVGGTVGKLDASNAAVHELRDSLERIKTLTMRTKLGNALVSFAKVIDWIDWIDRC